MIVYGVGRPVGIISWGGRDGCGLVTHRRDGRPMATRARATGARARAGNSRDRAKNRSRRRRMTRAEIACRALGARSPSRGRRST